MEGKMFYIDGHCDTLSRALDENKDLYKNDLIGTVDKEEANINKEITQITDILNLYEEVLNFLVKNKSSWTIENEQIVFNTDEQVNEYNKLISKIG